MCGRRRRGLDGTREVVLQRDTCYGKVVVTISMNSEQNDIKNMFDKYSKPYLEAVGLFVKEFVKDSNV